VTERVEIGLRPGRDADGARIGALIARVFSEYDGCLFELSEFPELAAPAAHYAARGGGLWVAERGDELVGCVALVLKRPPDLCELSKFYVAAACRGSGLAQRLHDRAIEEARRRGARELALFSDTRFDRAHAFYAKQGFARLPGVRFLHDASRSLENAYRRPLVGEAAA
jgi:putative acetyltransferase